MRALGPRGGGRLWQGVSFGHVALAESGGQRPPIPQPSSSADSPPGASAPTTTDSSLNQSPLKWIKVVLASSTDWRVSGSSFFPVVLAGWPVRRLVSQALTLTLTPVCCHILLKMYKPEAVLETIKFRSFCECSPSTTANKLLRQETQNNEFHTRLLVEKKNQLLNLTGF